MNSKTFNKRYDQLSSEVYKSPHMEELLNIMQQQLEDDTPVIDKQIIKRIK
tara:strand:- start:6 stop:158 length:153 start_codon:yes stop_codon:yes gene_type:complete